MDSLSRKVGSVMHSSKNLSLSSASSSPTLLINLKVQKINKTDKSKIYIYKLSHMAILIA